MRPSIARSLLPVLRRTVASGLLGLLVVLAHATPASANRFDLIYVDSLDVTLCSSCSVSLADAGFGLIVNTGGATLTVSDLNAIAFNATSSEPTIALSPQWSPSVGQPPVPPGVVMGSIRDGVNSVLLGPIRPGETLLNLYPHQDVIFNLGRTVRYAPSTFEGRVAFEVTMDMAGERASFTIYANVHLAPVAANGITFLSAARASSAPITTRTVRETWGQMKVGRRR